MAVRAPSLEDSNWLNHSPLSKKDLEGRVILLDFFTYCCMNCLNILSDLKSLEEAFGDKLLIIGIHSGKHPHEKEVSSIKSALEKYKIEHLVINDNDLKLWDAFGVKAWPTQVLVDSKGYIISTYQGEGHLENLTKDINKILLKINVIPKNIRIKKGQAPKGLLHFPQKIHVSKDYIFISQMDEVLICLHEGRVIQRIKDLKEPQGLVYIEDVLYIAISQGNQVLRVSENFTKIEVFLEGLRNPYDLESDGINLYITLAGAHQIKGFNLDTKDEVLIIGQANSESLHDASYSESILAQPTGLSLLEDELYFVDSESSSLRCASFNEVHSLIYDNDELQHPLDLTVGQYGDGCGGGRVFITDSYNNKVKVYNPETKEVITLLKDLSEPSGIDKKECKLYICNTNKHEIIIFDLSKMTNQVFKLKDSL